MRIGLDLLIHKETYAGIASYTSTLLEGLSKLGREHEYVLFVNRRAELDNRTTQFTNIRRLWAPTVGSAWWEQFSFADPLLTKDLDLVHNPYSAPLKWCRVKQVVTVHDIIPLVKPEVFTLRNRIYWHFVWQSLHKVDAIITVSKWSKQDILNYFHIDPDRVHVIYPALRFKDSGEDVVVGESVLAKYGIRRPYVLYVGTLEPRKNVTTLLKAISLLRAQDIRDIQIVIAGKKGWLYDEIFETLEGLNLNDAVVFTGFVSSSDLSVIYRNAVVFVFPSLYEGFGLPPLEAMSFGVPVIVSNRTSLPEVVGDAGILVDPRSPEEIAFHIQRVLEDSELRERLRNKGMERAKMFTVEKLAKETLRVYESVK